VKLQGISPQNVKCALSGQRKYFIIYSHTKIEKNQSQRRVLIRSLRVGREGYEETKT